MNWKKIAYVLVFGPLVIGGLVTVLYFGLQPRSVPKINLSSFSTPEEAGQAVGKRLWLELKDAPVLLLGVWPNHPEDIEVVRGLLNSLTEPGQGYDVVVVEPQLPGVDVFVGAQSISLRDEAARFVEGVKNARAQGKRVVAIVPSMFSSRLIAEGPADRLKKEFELDFVSLSIAPFPFSRDEEGTFEVQCMTGGDQTGFGALGCAVIQKARQNYRKKKDPTRYQGLMDLVGNQDYLLLLSPPRPLPPK